MSHHRLLAAGPLASDRRLVALCGARVVTIGDELGLVGARVRRLARPLPSRYAARNFSIEKTSASWMDALGRHFAQNVGKTPVRIILVEIKTSR